MRLFFFLFLFTSNIINCAAEEVKPPENSVNLNSPLTKMIFLADKYAYEQTELGQKDIKAAYQEAENIIKKVIELNQLFEKNLALVRLAQYHRDGKTILSLTDKAASFKEAEKYFKIALENIKDPEYKYTVLGELAMLHQMGHTEIGQKDKIAGLKEAERIYKILAEQNEYIPSKYTGLGSLISMQGNGETELSRQNTIEGYKEAEKFMNIIILHKDFDTWKTSAISQLAQFHYQGKSELSRKDRAASFKEAEKLWKLNNELQDELRKAYD